MKPPGQEMLDEKLLDAVIEGKVDDVRALIGKGADVDTRDTMDLTLLHHACRLGNINIVRILLKAGADVSAQDGNGNVPLDIVCATEFNVAISSLLLSHGANVDQRDRFRKETLLHVACREGLVEVTRFLLEKGADVNARDWWGNVPLTMARGLDPDSPHREEILDLFREHYPELVFETFCTSGPGI